MYGHGYRLEAIAVRRDPVRIIHRTPDGHEAVSEGLIVDLYTDAHKEEFLKLADATEIRLDRLVRILPLNSPGFFTPPGE